MKSKLYLAFLKSGHDFALTELKQSHESQDFHRLSYQDVLYLNIIECHPNKYTSSQIADLLKITRPAVSQKISELFKKGYVIRSQSQSDKRLHYLSINEESDYFEELDEEVLRTIETAVLSEYGAENLDLFCEMMDFISGQFELKLSKKEST